MYNTIIVKLFFFILVTQNIFSQEKYPQDYFISPLYTPLKLSGTFGELRSDHFHSGIDIKTEEVEGFKVYAIANGYVSRIKITSGGYGKALYITHPNGYVSVYAHLQKYNNSINEYVTNEQYNRESFTLDLYPEKDFLIVKKGEIIAFAGNTGRSGGPHLHFEIRNEATQKPINPLLFGFEVKDKIKPKINLLKVYPASPDALINHKNKASEFFTKWNGSYYTLNNNDTILVSGKVYFGVNTYDPFNKGKNKNGVYSIELLVDSNVIYAHDLEIFSFAETRYLNSLIDYKEYKLKKRMVQKSFIQPNNHLSIYKIAINRGIIDFNDNNVHKVTYFISDLAGNVSTLLFYVKSLMPVEKTISNTEQKEKTGKLLSYTTNNIFRTDDLIFEVPGKAIYDTLYFDYKVLPALNNSFSKVHQLHYDFVPLQTWCILLIKPDTLPAELQDKALIAKIDNNNEFTSVGGEWEDGYIKTRIREFGEYCILTDTTPPEIIPLNISNNKNIAKQNTIRIKITDELSGINSYRGTLNGKWILMEYDEKNDLLIYTFDERFQKGENIFELTVTDNNNNVNCYTIKLFY